MWIGSAAVCLNDKNRILMIQGKDLVEWAVPSGGLQENESLEDCCIREVKEETGYDVQIIRNLFIKEGEAEGGIHYQTHYFEVTLIGGDANINDPDGLVHNIGWLSLEQIDGAKHAYPEDKDFLIKYLREKLTESE